MSRDSTVIPFRQPDVFDDPLTDLAREGARRILAQVLVAEADAFVAMWDDGSLHCTTVKISARNAPVSRRRGDFRISSGPDLAVGFG